LIAHDDEADVISFDDEWRDADEAARVIEARPLSHRRSAWLLVALVVILIFFSPRLLSECCTTHAYHHFRHMTLCGLSYSSESSTAICSL
jgi:hypothetical protein